MVGIYKIISPTKRIYIGQSIDLEKREKDYYYGKCVNQVRLIKSIKKYGWKYHQFIIIEVCEIDLLNIRERYWQDYYNVLGAKGLNCKLTNTDDKAGILSEDTKNKIKNSLKGKKHSEQRRVNQSIAQMGKKRSLSHKLSLSKAAKRRFKDESERKKQGFKLMMEVEQYDKNLNLIATYCSVREAEKITTIHSSTISRCCNNTRKSAGGFIWKYKKQSNTH